MIAIQVSQILQEELYDIMDQIIGRLIVRFEERTESLKSMGRTFEVTTGGDLDVGTRLRKRKRDLSAIDEEFKVANLGTGIQGGFDICRKYGGTHMFDYHKFKCYMYRWKGNFIRDCKKDLMCFRCHQSGYLKPECPAWVAEGVQA